MRRRALRAPAMSALVFSDPPQVAAIEERLCIGCTLCIKACPVDAIAGATKLMHTVIAAECTGCGLCIPPCPVDCIAMVETPGARSGEQVERARGRHIARGARLERAKQEHAARQKAARDEMAEGRKRATIERAMQRARERLKNRY